MWGVEFRPIAIAAILGIQAVLVTALPTSAVVASSEMSTGASTGTVPSATAFKRRRTFNCNQNNVFKNIEAKAWADAGGLAEIAAQYDSGNEWQPAMDYWMGGDSKDPNNFWKIQSRRSFAQNKTSLIKPQTCLRTNRKSIIRICFFLKLSWISIAATLHLTAKCVDLRRIPQTQTTHSRQLWPGLHEDYSGTLTKLSFVRDSLKISLPWIICWTIYPKKTADGTRA